MRNSRAADGAKAGSASCRRAGLGVDLGVPVESRIDDVFAQADKLGLTAKPRARRSCTAEARLATGTAIGNPSHRPVLVSDLFFGREYVDCRGVDLQAFLQFRIVSDELSMTDLEIFIVAESPGERRGGAVGVANPRLEQLLQVEVLVRQVPPRDVGLHGKLRHAESA